MKEIDRTYYSCNIELTQKMAYHFSKDMIFYLVLGGDGQVRYQDKNVHIHVGDFLFFSPYALHSLVGFHSLKYMEIRLYPRFFQTLSREGTAPVFRNFYITENLKDQRSIDIYRRIAEFIHTDVLKETAFSLEALTKLSELYLVLCRYFQGTNDPEDPSEDYIQERIKRILQYIEQHYTHRITLQEISHELGLNPQYFSVFFSRYFRQTFVDFLNEYRIGSSMTGLCKSSTDLTGLSLECGFQTYKSYSNAFRKLYHCSPSEYRKRHLSSGAETSDRAEFRFLQKYMTGEPASVPQEFLRDMTLELDLSQAPVIAEDHRIHAVSIGSCYQLLQENVYQQLQKAAKECHFTHVHFRDVFCDLLNVYTEPVPNQPLITWDYIDDVIRKILDLGMAPYIEIGFMPRELSATGETLGFGYHPCTGVPKSFALWEQLIRSFLDHYLKLYGIREMRNWRFDFWNSANIRSSDGYWNAEREEFFHLYSVTYRVFRDVAPELKLGTPNFSLPSGYIWYEEFLKLCSRSEMSPDYLAAHLYSCNDGLQDFQGIFPYTTTYNYLSRTNMELIRDNLLRLRTMLEEYGFGQIPIYISEWNISFYLSDLVRDTAFMATYIVRNWIGTLSLAECLTYSNLSDISENTRPSPLLFPGSQGMFTRDSLPKPAYHALFLLHKLDREVICDTEGCFITRGEAGWHILLYNMSDYKMDQERDPSFLSDDYRYHVFQRTDDVAFRGEFRIPYGSYQIVTYLLDQEHGCAYDAWIRMGSPEPLSSEIRQALLHASCPDLHFEKRENIRTLKLQKTLPAHSVMLFEIRRL